MSWTGMQLVNLYASWEFRYEMVNADEMFAAQIVIPSCELQDNGQPFPLTLGN